MSISTLGRAFSARPQTPSPRLDLKPPAWQWFGWVVLALAPATLWAQSGNPRSIVHKLEGATERMEMTVKTSRVLTLDRPIPTAQVNDSEVLDLQPLGPDQILIVAKKPGV